jgi:hypothetical protein
MTSRTLGYRSDVIHYATLQVSTRRNEPGHVQKARNRIPDCNTSRAITV